MVTIPKSRTIPLSSVFEAHMYVFFIIDMKTPMLVKWSCRHVSPIILTSEVRKVIIFSTLSPIISFKHVCFSYPFLETHLATYYSHIGVLNEWGVYGLTQIITPLSTYHLVVVYAHPVDA